MDSSRALLRWFLAAWVIVWVAVPINAQQRNANWLLPNSWMSFQGGAPILVDMSIQGTIQASLSNTSGNLRVYFRSSWPAAILGGDHQPIGDHPELMGMFGGIQSAVFVPKPGDLESCFLLLWNQLIETDEWRWGILEIFLGPLGDQPIAIGDIQWFMSDAVRKRMVIPHANGVDYWFVTQERWSFAFHAFHITAQGISGTPVIGSPGSVLQPDQWSGILVPDRSGTRFISTHEYDLISPEVPTDIALYAFDPATGVTDLQLELPDLLRVRGAEFSPSGRYLYVADRTVNTPGANSRRLFQYDLDVAPFMGTCVLIDSAYYGPSYLNTTSTLQAAPDGKIYMAHDAFHTHPAVIAAPDEAGTGCTYVDPGFQCLDQVFTLPSFAKRYHDDPGPSGVSISELRTGDGARVVPSPLEGSGALWWPTALGTVEVVWTDLRGREVRREHSPIGEGRVPLNSAGLAPGTYVLRCRTASGQQVVHRVVVAQ